MTSRTKAHKFALQPYPRRRESLIAADVLFARAKPIDDDRLSMAVRAAFERTLTRKSGAKERPGLSPEKLVKMCLQHLRERSDPVLTPAFLSQCAPIEVFELDAIAHEMQRHRMKMGNFYQFLVIELMKTRFERVFDGKREGDIEAEIEPPVFAPGLRLYISVKKSADTVGGQDIGGVIARLETMAKQDKNLTRPYLGVVAVATPPKGEIHDFAGSRSVRFKDDGAPYSPNCELWFPGFIYPFACGRDPVAVYREALRQLGRYMPFNALVYRKECGKMLARQLSKMGLIDQSTGRIDPEKFQDFVIAESASTQREEGDDHE